MKETFYFPHDFNATQDPKMIAVLSCCGMQGVGMYWTLIEILHQQQESKILHKNYEDYIEFYCRGSNEQVLNTIKQVLINTKLLIKDGEYVYSERVLNNKKERQRISELRSFAGKKSAQVRADSTNVEHVLNKTQQSKVNKSKVKENKDIQIRATKVATLEEMVEPFKNKFSQDTIERFLNHWTEKNPDGNKERWQMEKVFDPLKRLLTWKRNDEKWAFEKSQRFQLKSVNEKPVHHEPRHSDKGISFSKITFDEEKEETYED